MINKWLVGLVVSFLLKQLQIFTDKFDWAKFEADLQKKAEDFLPGTYFDAEGRAFAGALVEGLHELAADSTAWSAILQLLAEQNFHDAGTAVIKLLQDVWLPHTQNPAAAKIKAALAA